uniref:Interleukin 22 receptor subunit alpha 1 n=1 Tax=Bos mutus grunniens TaxID=30521 RepID=A0A8B9WS27_BOSMU
MNQPPDQINKPVCHCCCFLQLGRELPWVPPRTWNSEAHGPGTFVPSSPLPRSHLSSFPRPRAWVEPAAKAPKLLSPPSGLSLKWRPREGPVPGPDEDATDHPGGGIPARYGEEEWLEKEGCQRITQKSCNLTMETSNLTELYYARVTATDGAGRSATKMTNRFSSLQHTSIKPPDVTCIPKVRSIQMIVHPTYTPIRAQNGHQLTLENIFQDLLYHLKLRINHTYQMHLEGKQREFEFVGLTPDTEFLGTIMICIPNLFKESTPYMCRVKTLPDRTWTYSFSGAFLFSLGFLVAGLCYLSYRYITKPPPPPSSLNVQHILPFQPLRFIQEHTLIPVFDLSGSGGLAQPVQYSEVKVSDPTEPLGPPPRHSLPEIAYLGQPDFPVLRPSGGPLTRHSPCSPMPPRLLPRAGPRPMHLRELWKLNPPPTLHRLSQRPSFPPTPHGPPRITGLLPTGCAGKGLGETPPVTRSGPKHLGTKGQLQKEVPAGSCSPTGLSLQEVTPLAMEDPQEAKSSHQCLRVHTDSDSDSDTIGQREPGTRSSLKGQLPLLSSVQIEGHPGCLPLQTPSLPCSPTDKGPSPWGLLESLVCPSDEDPVSKTEAESPGLQAPDLESPTELDSLFRGLALTVQWES